MDLIYQEVWDADQGANGLPALRPQEEKDEARGYVVVDERSTDVGSDHRVIAEVSFRPAYSLERIHITFVARGGGALSVREAA